MAAGILAEPGSPNGPCQELCQHIDCAESRRMAAAPCDRCQEPIGYNRRFYSIKHEPNRQGEFVHADCEEDAVEAERKQKAQPRS